ncbi:hydroxymethylglutaryl-CoA reductase, degradative [Streptococcus anginosus]|uniref:3-hydroxy-3-methylglutaryl coenzyme A reductase n=1 Tax=Streptococcus anginosus TaxID=1328 RepID=A0AAW5TJ93_STRAP|nr:MULTISPECIES: hydroxymethylglutaryl-CoA reductase, degradative [Streptococcus]KAA9247379.1 hydroxymethylglutaryl-CoA reductase, degradative [Streptococcus anginosus]KAA9253136.1 hydroxymethylglutaryl-CoA reductase, degradative [Streptococcus anginosus]KAA9258740.1 hydroxymethylglutaryl-CoA reductase, degradative [Streptococcus anginosus]KAA9261525.1 hydroxymethylglutaryl-CoA reductase, degradative [Streptococcus anginosus]KAA9302988.1 hydroxymethylglutaryl-CoA reductase, degradative [Strept
MKISWTGFSKKSLQERLQILKDYHLLNEDNQTNLEHNHMLPLSTADQMSENVLATFALPYSFVPDVLVDEEVYQVPFVTEEPSVVAAASFAAKIIKRSGGFKTTIHNRQMIGQVALYQVANIEVAIKNIQNHKQELLELANQAHPSIVNRGGGACDLRVEWLNGEAEFLVVYLTVDTQEAMGANILNTMLEALKTPLEELTGGESLMAILSNYATEALVTATCEIDIRFLDRNKSEALDIAKKIVLASQFAKQDPYRASTHNKGIFNGIDAVVLATGNDWRAIEAGAHTYASRNGSYQGLTTWSIKEATQTLCGEITLPLPIATKGGSIGLNPTVEVSFDLLKQPTAKEFASIIASIGLAQNFAALKALVSTGIQHGHMKLQAKSLALLAGAKDTEIAPLISQLVSEKHFSLKRAQEILENIRQKS